jgi:hypothetical protein
VRGGERHQFPLKAVEVQSSTGGDVGDVPRREHALALGGAAGLARLGRVILGGPGYYQITNAGLAVIGSDLPPPHLHPDGWRHDLSAAWVWVAGARGTFGPVDRVLSQREMRAHGAAPTTATRDDERIEHPFGVRVASTVTGKPTALHYPDVLLITPQHERVAIELVLSSNGQQRLETTLAGYGADPTIEAVLYLAENPAIRHNIKRTAERLGISDRIRVQELATRRGTPATRG